MTAIMPSGDLEAQIRSVGPFLRVLSCAALLTSCASARAAPQIVYVAIGGWGEVPGAAREGDPARIASALEASGRRVRVVDLTAAGAKARAVREKQIGSAISLRPTLVSVSVGPLDLVGGTPLAAFSRELQIVTDLLRGTRATIIIASVPRGDALRDGASRGFRRRADAFQWAIRRAARRNGAIVADVRARGDPTWASAMTRSVLSTFAPASSPPDSPDDAADRRAGPGGGHGGGRRPRSVARAP